MDRQTKPDRALCQRSSRPVPLSSGYHRGLFVHWCVCVCVRTCAHFRCFSSHSIQDELLSALHRRAVTALFSTCLQLSDTQLGRCVCVCFQAHKAESRQQSELLIFHAFKTIPLQSVYLVASQRVITRGKVDSAGGL